MIRDKKFFTKQIDSAVDDYFVQAKSAPTRGGWDPVFRKRIDSKSQVKRALMNTIQDIAEVAKIYGVDLSGFNKAIEELE